MYRWIHVAPVGTSLLGNFQRSFPNVVKDWGFENWDRWSPEDPRQDTLCSRFSEVSEKLIDFIKDRGASACAELAPLERALEVFGHGASETMVILYSTQTCNSRLAREAIATYLRGRGLHVQEAEVRGISSVDDFEEGLVDILDKVVRLIASWKRRGAGVFINATPGFKAEASFLVIASLLAEADAAYYMHESFRELVILPAIPLEIRRQYLETAKKFLKTKTPSEAEDIAGSPERLRELELRGLVARTPTGYTARKWFRKLLEITSQTETV